VFTKFITSVLSNFTLTFLVVGVFCSLVALVSRPKPLNREVVIEAFFSYYLLFSIGISYIYNFALHVFFSKISAEFIGWADSPFQFEVGVASLGFGIVGLIAVRGSLGFRAAAIIAPAFFLWGAAGGHIYQIIKYQNYAPGNAGVILWTDIILPFIGFGLLYLSYKFPLGRE